jgi:site-specific recombinase XerD
MKRQAMPQFSPSEKLALAAFEQTLIGQVDLASASICNYLSDVRHFIAWYECYMNTEAHIFTLQIITTPILTRYRAYLQTDQRQRPTSVNRSLVSLKRYFGWAKQKQFKSYNPSAPVKLDGQEKAEGTLSDRMFGYVVKKYADIAKLANVSPHDLRYRFGHPMAESVPLHRLAQNIGHDSLDTTKMYIQGMKHDLQQVVETIAWT